MEKAKVFYSYSHKDERYRKKLETHLSILQKNGLIEEWHDRRIGAGHDWEEEINLNLEESNIILLLVSSHFLASNYCYDTETIRALEKHDKKESVVIPIIVRPCLWRESKLKTLQALPTDGKAISTSENEDQAWVNVCNAILREVEQLRTVSPLADPTKSLQPLNQQTGSGRELILKFLREYNQWYFSPLRIQKWGSKQHGFEALRAMSTRDIRGCLDRLHTDRLVKVTTSQKGNSIYKAVDA
ncbi:MAG TPA: toll/interleukin-1 receptor domain-containing protein [Terrimicrobiaceae bacterium]